MATQCSFFFVGNGSQIKSPLLTKKNEYLLAPRRVHEREEDQGHPHGQGVLSERRTRVIHTGRVLCVKARITDRCGNNSRLSQGDRTICNES
jgi:hypothetical protein